MPKDRICYRRSEPFNIECKRGDGAIGRIDIVEIVAVWINCEGFVVVKIVKFIIVKIEGFVVIKIVRFVKFMGPGNIVTRRVQVGDTYVIGVEGALVKGVKMRMRMDICAIDSGAVEILVEDVRTMRMNGHGVGRRMVGILVKGARELKVMMDICVIDGRVVEGMLVGGDRERIGEICAIRRSVAEGVLVRGVRGKEAQQIARLIDGNTVEILIDSSEAEILFGSVEGTKVKMDAYVIGCKMAGMLVDAVR